MKVKHWKSFVLEVVMPLILNLIGMNLFEIYNVEYFIGESGSWGQTLMGGLIGALIAAGVTLLVFYLDSSRRKKQNRDSEEKHLNEQLNHFLYLFKKIIEDKLGTVKMDKAYADSYLKDPMGRPPLKIEFIGSIERIMKIDSNDIRKALVLNQRKYKMDVEKLFRELYTVLDLYESHTSQRPVRIDVLSKQRDSLGERLVNDVDSFRVSFRKVILQIEKRGEDSPLHEYQPIFKDILEEYESHLDPMVASNFNFHENYLLNPFLQTEKKDKLIYGYFGKLYNKAHLLSFLFSRYAANGHDLRDLIEGFNEALKDRNSTVIQLIQDNFDSKFVVK